jgi:hypothetical protein
VFLLLTACKGAGGTGAPPARGDRVVTPAPGAAAGEPEEAAPAAPTAAPAPTAPEAGKVLVMAEERGEKAERWMEADAAVAAGYTIVDLRDEWTPYIFAEQRNEAGQPLPNRYRRVFIGLANDQLDGDGQPLDPGEKNYLELYGIFPSLSVLRERFLEDETRTCLDPAALPALEAVETVSYVSPTELRRDAARLARTRVELEAARKKARAPTLAVLIEKEPQHAPKLKLLEKRAAEKLAMAEVEKRLVCEKLLSTQAPPATARKNKVVLARYHQTGIYDDAMRLAVRGFQQKNMIYEANYLRRKTMDAMERPTLANDHDSLVRVLRERVISAAGIVEDGSAEGKGGPLKYTNAAGEKVPIRNLAEEYTKEAVAQLGLDTPENALAFFKRHPAADFRTLRAGVKLPPRPEYYGPDMDLSIIVDRGDVWYDPPFDDKDKWTVRSRKRYPSLTLMLRYRDQNLPLSRWRSTIGGWRSEQAPNGYEYYRYKGSDVGPRVIRQVISGPVWIAPSSTPIRSLVKSRSVHGSWQTVINYDELGPGYLSAYGVVAGYFVIPGKEGRPDFDNGIRAHGSADYLSIYSANGYSHGCHRLPNHLAIRLYSFILQHRTKRVAGDSPMGFARQFLWKDSAYEMRIPSRGYIYQLEPPLPVTVLEGEIKGNAKSPIKGYVPKPGVRYPPGPPPPAPDSPEARAGGAGAAAAPGGGDDRW